MGNARPGHSSPHAGFEAPLEMLAACHGRIGQQCQTLRRLLAHLPLNGADRQAQEAAAAVMRYLESAACHHLEDGEQHLFPRAARIDGRLGRTLSAQHDRVAERRAPPARTSLAAHARHARCRDHGPRAPLDAAQVEDFVAARLLHVAREDAELLPMASRLLGDDALCDIGRAMRRRRGIAELP
jgi:hemerythrin-like domain-containing protein